MDELMKLMLKQNLPITKYEMDEYWLDIGRVEDYEKAQIELKNNFNNK